MNVKNIKTEPDRVDIFPGLALEIQNYGIKNDYPQRIIQITKASVSAKGCIDTYAKFINGRGFRDIPFYQFQVNSDGLLTDQLLNRVSKDIARFNGFVLHVNYTALGERSEVNFVPFENARLGLEDEKGKVTKIALHRDWTKKKRKTVVSKNTIDYIDTYNPIPTVVQAQIEAVGGIENYKGQVLYYNMETGDWTNPTYPEPKYDSAITDVSSDTGISNVLYRNVRMNFLPSGILIRQKGEPNGDDDTDKDTDDPSGWSVKFKEFQGDENACKIIDVEVDAEEVKPEFIQFEIQARSTEMKTTKSMISENIGKAFMQPPILRAENVQTGFTLEAMKDAYTFYNSVTEPERIEIERVFKMIFTNFTGNPNQSNDYSIEALTYGTVTPTV